MKARKIAIALGAVILGTGCAPDTGNYTYKALNTIDITVDMSYDVDQFDNLVIEPVLSFKQEQIADLSFEWVIDNNEESTVISTERICNGQVTAMPDATYNAYLCVTDNKSGLKYYKTFEVKVKSPYSTALLVLREMADGTASLSSQRRDRENAPWIHNIFESVNPDFGALGTKPVAFFSTVNLTSGINSSIGTKKLSVLCKEGERKIVSLNKSSMVIEGFQNESTISGYSGTFAPDYAWSYSSVGGMVVSGGRPFLFDVSGLGLLDNMKELAGYNFAWLGSDGPFTSSAYVGYDKTSRKFLLLEPVGSNDYNNVTEITGDAPAAGEEFLLGGACKFNYGGMMGATLQPRLIFLDAANTAYFYKINLFCDIDWMSGQTIITVSTTRQYTKSGLLTPASLGTLGNDLYWYIANDNKITRFHSNDGTNQSEWFTAPKGKIVDMMTDWRGTGKPSRLIVATWDGTKSYVYVIDMANANTILETLPEMDGRIVDMTVAGSTWVY